MSSSSFPYKHRKYAVIPKDQQEVFDKGTPWAVDLTHAEHGAVLVPLPVLAAAQEVYRHEEALDTTKVGQKRPRESPSASKRPPAPPPASSPARSSPLPSRATELSWSPSPSPHSREGKATFGSQLVVETPGAPKTLTNQTPKSRSTRTPEPRPVQSPRPSASSPPQQSLRVPPTPYAAPPPVSTAPPSSNPEPSLPAWAQPTQASSDLRSSQHATFAKPSPQKPNHPRKLLPPPESSDIEELETELPQAKPLTQSGLVNQIASTEPSQLFSSSIQTPPCAQPPMQTIPMTIASEPRPVEAPIRTRRFKAGMAIWSDDTPGSSRTGETSKTLASEPSLRRRATMPLNIEQGSISSSPAHRSPSQAFEQVLGASPKAAETLRQTPQKDDDWPYKIPRNAVADIYSVFTDVYPFYTKDNNGSLGHFLQACVTLKTLRDRRVLFFCHLFDDFIRAYSSEYLDYASRAQQGGRELIPAWEWYALAMEGEPAPKTNRGVVTAHNLDTILRSYSYEVAEVMKQVRTMLSPNHRVPIRSTRPKTSDEVYQTLEPKDTNMHHHLEMGSHQSPKDMTTYRESMVLDEFISSPAPQIVASTATEPGQPTALPQPRRQPSKANAQTNDSASPVPPPQRARSSSKPTARRGFSSLSYFRPAGSPAPPSTAGREGETPAQLEERMRRMVEKKKIRERRQQRLSEAGSRRGSVVLGSRHG